MHMRRNQINTLTVHPLSAPSHVPFAHLLVIEHLECAVLKLAFFQLPERSRQLDRLRDVSQGSQSSSPSIRLGRTSA